jgi:hypothetical protein
MILRLFYLDCSNYISHFIYVSERIVCLLPDSGKSIPVSGTGAKKYFRFLYPLAHLYRTVYRLPEFFNARL